MKNENEDSFQGTSETSQPVPNLVLKGIDFAIETLKKIKAHIVNSPTPTEEANNDHRDSNHDGDCWKWHASQQQSSTNKSTSRKCDQVDWEDIGKSIKKGMESVDWDGVGDTIKKGVEAVDWKKVESSVKEEMTSVDWKELGEEISKAFEEMKEEIDTATTTTSTVQPTAPRVEEEEYDIPVIAVPEENDDIPFADAKIVTIDEQERPDDRV